MNGRDVLKISKNVIKTGKEVVVDGKVINLEIAEAVVDWFDNSNRPEKKKLLNMSGVAILKNVNDSLYNK
ncbi:MAG: hypothetical protein ACFFCS_28930 [Candidatus Hodarchaeota archaeon]